MVSLLVLLARIYRLLSFKTLLIINKMKILIVQLLREKEKKLKDLIQII